MSGGSRRAVGGGWDRDVFRVFAEMPLEKEQVQVPGERRAEGLRAVWALEGE